MLAEFSIHKHIAARRFLLLVIPERTREMTLTLEEDLIPGRLFTFTSRQTQSVV
jgi:hypothetical protein